MSNFRRAPNVSQYVANLNTITPPPGSDPSGVGAGDLQQDGSAFSGLVEDDELALFTNTQFFDFDMGESVAGGGEQVEEYDAVMEAKARRENAAAHGHGKRGFGVAGLEFLGGDYTFTDFAADFSTTGTIPAASSSAVGGPDGLPLVGGIDPQTPVSSPTDLFSPLPHAPTTTTHKRQSSTSPTTQGSPSNQTLESASRLAAEEDKRRRNTAASARFRVKKKQREQALERQAREMTEKCARLEARVGQLEMENKWLKNLITEKNENKDEVAELWRKFRTEGNPTGGSVTTVEGARRLKGKEGKGEQ